MKPPICKKITQHGYTRMDNYAWLRDSNWKDIIDGKLNFENPEILEYITALNQHRDTVMSEYKDIEEELYKEIISRIQEDKVSYPFLKGNYYYYYKEKKGLNYKILCRKKASNNSEMSDQEEIYFDINREAGDRKLYSFRSSEVNANNKYLAYMFNTSGSLEGTLKVRDLLSGKDLDWEIPNTTGNFQWISDIELYYVERDENLRGKRIYKINVTKGMASKEMVKKQLGVFYS